MEPSIEDLLLALAAVGGWTGLIAGAIALAVYYFREIVRLRGHPNPVHLNVGVTRPAAFFLEHKPSRSLRFQAIPDGHPVAFYKTSNVFSDAPSKPQLLAAGEIEVPLTGLSVGSGTYEALTVGTQPGEFIRSPPIDVIVHPGYDYVGHPAPRWRWTKVQNAGVYELVGSKEKDFVCFEYTIKKATWDEDNPSPPLTSGTCDDSTLFGLLEEAGYLEVTDSAGCGCGSGQNRYCVVVYQNKSGNIWHCAVFDRVLCDWGGKMANDLPIMRFKEPADYIDSFPPTEHQDVVMRFFCLAPDRPEPDYISDERLFNLAEGEE